MKRFFFTICFVLYFCTGQAIASDPRILMTFANWVPMSFVDGDGNGQGLLVEIAKEVFEKELGIPLDVKVRPWKRAQSDVENGRSDFIITVPTASRKSYALASARVFYTLPLYIYTYAGHDKLEAIHNIRDAEDIKFLNLIPVTNLGNGWHKDNVDAFGINTHYVGKEESILRFLASRRADIMIDAVVPTNYLINKNSLNQKVILTDARFSQVDFHLLLSKKSMFSSRMDDIDAAFERAEKNGRIQSIVTRYEARSD